MAHITSTFHSAPRWAHALCVCSSWSQPLCPNQAGAPYRAQVSLPVSSLPSLPSAGLGRAVTPQSHFIDGLVSIWGTSGRQTAAAQFSACSQHSLREPAVSCPPSPQAITQLSRHLPPSAPTFTRALPSSRLLPPITDYPTQLLFSVFSHVELLRPGRLTICCHLLFWGFSFGMTLVSLTRQWVLPGPALSLLLPMGAWKAASAG